jgi:hypothetical protein
MVLLVQAPPPLERPTLPSHERSVLIGAPAEAGDERTQREASPCGVVIALTVALVLGFVAFRLTS